MSVPSGSPNIPAIVLGSGVVTLGALRALGRQGITAYAAEVRPGLERTSRWYRPVPGAWTHDSLEQNLRGCSLPSAVLIPASDKAALETAALSQDLSARYPSSSAEPDLVAALLDKARLSELMKRHGVRHPRTWTIEAPADLEQLQDQALDQVFLKPRDSFRFSQRFNQKSLRPVGRESMLRTLSELTAEGFAMVVQEYIPGPASNGYLLDGFIDRDGNLCGLFARQRLRMYPTDFGNSSALRSIPREEVSEAEDTLVDLLGKLRYRGIFNAEFKRDERDGSFYLFEINPRAWWYVEFAARCGVDTVTMAYRDALDLRVEPVEGYQVGRRAIYPYYDLHACVDAWRDGAAEPWPMLRSWVGADQMVFARDDPRPFLTEVFGLARRYLGRRVPWRR